MESIKEQELKKIRDNLLKQEEMLKTNISHVKDKAINQSIIRKITSIVANLGTSSVYENKELDILITHTNQYNHYTHSAEYNYTIIINNKTVFKAENNNIISFLQGDWQNLFNQIFEQSLCKERENKLEEEIRSAQNRLRIHQHKAKLFGIDIPTGD